MFVAISPVIYWSVYPFSTRGEIMGKTGGCGGSLFQSAKSFTLLEYMIIMCKIQVIINPLQSVCVVNFYNPPPPRRTMTLAENSYVNLA